MRKYYAFVFFVFLSTFSVVAQTESNKQDNETTETQNPLVVFLSIFDSHNVHFRSIIEDYFYAEDSSIEPSVVTEDFLAIVARTDSRVFSLSKQTIFDSLLYDMVEAATKNINAMDARKVAYIADDILRHNNDVLILEQAVNLYAKAVERLNDEDAKHTFTRTTIFMLQRIVFSSDQYTAAYLIKKAVPYVTQVVNKKITTDTSIISVILNIFNEINVPDAYKTVRQLFSKILDVEKLKL